MAQEIESNSAPLFQFDQAAPSASAPQSSGGGLMRGVVTFCSVAIAALMISTAVIWVANRKPTPNASANTFLWFAGQNKTWDQYQRQQKAAGRGRLDENEYDWMQQLINDAYSRER